MMERYGAWQVVEAIAFLFGATTLLWTLGGLVMRMCFNSLHAVELRNLRARFPPAPVSRWRRWFSRSRGWLRFPNLRGWRYWGSNEWMCALTPTDRGIAVRQMPCTPSLGGIALFVPWNCLSPPTEEKGWVTNRVVLRIAGTSASLVLSTRDWNREFRPLLAEWQQHQASAPPESSQPTAP